MKDQMVEVILCRMICQKSSVFKKVCRTTLSMRVVLTVFKYFYLSKKRLSNLKSKLLAVDRWGWDILVSKYFVFFLLFARPLDIPGSTRNVTTKHTIV